MRRPYLPSRPALSASNLQHTTPVSLALRPRPRHPPEVSRSATGMGGPLSRLPHQTPRLGWFCSLCKRVGERTRCRFRASPRNPHTRRRTYRTAISISSGRPTVHFLSQESPGAVAQDGVHISFVDLIREQKCIAPSGDSSSLVNLCMSPR